MPSSAPINFSLIVHYVWSSKILSHIKINCCTLIGKLWQHSWPWFSTLIYLNNNVLPMKGLELAWDLKLSWPRPLTNNLRRCFLWPQWRVLSVLLWKIYDFFSINSVIDPKNKIVFCIFNIIALSDYCGLWWPKTAVGNLRECKSQKSVRWVRCVRARLWLISIIIRRTTKKY